VITWLRHGRVQLALHRLRDGSGRPLLLLHGLGLSTPQEVPGEVAAWPGPVHGLDFTGHGRSTIPTGGGYTAELLMADADAALAELGEVTVVGRGVGAYVALLLAGGRPELVRGAVLADGPGLAGSGGKPSSSHIAAVDAGAGAPPDPYALVDLSRDIRPPDYATTFVRQANQLSGLEWPIHVAAIQRPDWLTAVVAEPGVREGTVEEGIDRYRQEIEPPVS
jgi:pimeloyl-ACP methyl ester carboxylesterase